MNFVITKHAAERFKERFPTKVGFYCPRIMLKKEFFKSHDVTAQSQVHMNYIYKEYGFDKLFSLRKCGPVLFVCVIEEDQTVILTVLKD